MSFESCWLVQFYFVVFSHNDLFSVIMWKLLSFQPKLYYFKYISAPANFQASSVSSLPFSLYSRVEKYHSEAITKVKHTTAMAVQRLVTELETGGNVRFEDGTASDIWLDWQQELIKCIHVCYFLISFSWDSSDSKKQKNICNIQFEYKMWYITEACCLLNLYNVMM